MDILVELPAESLSFSEAALEQVLAAGISSDQNQVKRAADQLKEWETKEGFYSLLQSIFIDDNLPTPIRLLAVTQFKNGIDKYWRRAATNAIRPTERSRIRSKLFATALDENNEQIAKFNAIATAKIARFDFPGQWPDLIKDLVVFLHHAAVPSASGSALLRALRITLDLVKELSTVRLQRARASLQETAPDLFRILSDIYFLKIDEWQQIFSRDPSQADEAKILRMVESEGALKIIRRLFIAGFEFPDRHEILQNFWRASQRHVKQYQNLVLQPNVSEKYIEMLGNHLKQLAKLHVNVARDHQISFALLPDTASLVHNYWTSANAWRRQQIDSPLNEAPVLNHIFDAFNLRMLLVVRTCLRTAVSPAVVPFKYKGSQGGNDPATAREYLKNEIFTPQFVKDIFEKVVTFFLVMLPDEIEDWISDPEEYEFKEEAEENAYELSVRSCAERLLLDVCIHCKDTIMNDLLSLANKASDSSFQTSAKDAVYAAVGAAAPILQDKFDFNNLLTTNLVAELQTQNHNQIWLRRRIAVLVAQWIGVGISEANRPLVYQMYQHLLDKEIPSNQLFVRITAGKRFKDIADDWEFKSEQFSPYAPTILRQVIELMQEVELEDTQIALLNTVGAIVERMEQDVKPFAEQLISLLPGLWNASMKAHLMKQSIVTVLTKLVNALEGDSGPLHPLVLPIVKDAVEPNSVTQQYLLEDALDLWIAVTTQAHAPISPELLSLAPLLHPLFSFETETIEKAIRIQESYIFLAPNEILLGERREEFFHGATTLLNVTKPTIIDSVCGNIELALRAAEALSGTRALNVIVDGLWDIGFLSHILNSIHANWESHQTTGPNRRDPPQDWRNESDYFSILARIILASTQTFLTLVQKWAAFRDFGFDETVTRVLKEWFESIDAVNNPVQLKLSALALTKLLETGQAWILIKLHDLMNLWTVVLLELRDGEDDVGGDSLVYAKPDSAGNGNSISTSVPEQERRRAVMYSDPVHTINLNDFVKHHLGGVVAGCGGEAAFREQWLVNVDPEVVTSFGELGIM